MERLVFKVFDKNGKDVTDTNDWYIDQNGDLYFETSDIDCPLVLADDYTYRFVEPCMELEDLEV